MNFYKHHLGDYAASTAHLSMQEHGAYLLMLHHHYATEQPLPDDVGTIARIIRAASKAEIVAIQSVLRQFWERTASGWVQRRAQAEMERAAYQRDVNREIGKRGGRPKKTESVSENQTEQKTESVSETEPNRNPSQTPDTRHQTKAVVSQSEQVTPTGVGPPEVAVCSRLQSAGISGTNPSNARLRALLAAGLSVEEIASLGEEPRARGKSMAWVLAAAEGRRRDADRVASLPVNRQQSVEDRNRAVAAQWMPPEMRQGAQA